MTKKNRKIRRNGIVAEGEVTGHAHRVQGASVYEYDDGHLGVVPHTDTPFKVTHEEHNVVEVDPRRFKADEWDIRIVVEKDHAEDALRRVAD